MSSGSMQNWVLLVIDAAEKPISPVQLQKSLFLVGEKFKEMLGEDYYNFAPHHYGPFSIDIYNDLDNLVSDGYVNAHKLLGRNWFEYSLSENGQKLISDTEQHITQDIKDYICRLVPQVQKLSFEQLISAIYSQFPEYSVNSVFRK